VIRGLIIVLSLCVYTANFYLRFISSLLLWDAQKAYWIGSTIAQVEAALLGFLAIFILFRAEQLRNEFNNISEDVDNLITDDYLLNSLMNNVLHTDYGTLIRRVYSKVLVEIRAGNMSVLVIEKRISGDYFPSVKQARALIDKITDYIGRIKNIKGSLVSKISEDGLLQQQGVAFFESAEIRWQNSNEEIVHMTLSGYIDDFIDGCVKEYEKLSRSLEEYINAVSDFNDIPYQNAPSKYVKYKESLSVFPVPDNLRWPYKIGLFNADFERIKHSLRNGHYRFEERVAKGFLTRLMNIILPNIQDDSINQRFMRIDSVSRDLVFNIGRVTWLYDLFLSLISDYENLVKTRKRLINESKTRLIGLAIIILYSVVYLIFINASNDTLLYMFPFSLLLIASFVSFIVITLIAIIGTFRFSV